MPRKYRKSFARKKKPTSKKKFRTQNTRTYRGRKNFVRKRAPLVETKKLESGMAVVTLDQDEEIRALPVRSFYKFEQGTGKDQFTGDNIFSKYVSMKMKLIFPGQEHSIEENFRMRVIWGWMTSPLGLPKNGTFAPYYPNRSEVSVSTLEQLVADRVMADFDTPYKSLEFRDKERKIYKIIGQRWVKPDRRYQIGHPQDSKVNVYLSDIEASTYELGQPPDWSTTLTWRPMRKIPLTKSNLQGEDEFYYPNESWIPFVMIYTPNISSYPTDPASGQKDPLSKITVQYNDCHWYSDS